ncbi:MAG: DUF2219 family protein [Cryomorphaceae bacterium]|nr:DUF2219 family protein [Cryomorphaceae bacterium]
MKNKLKISICFSLSFFMLFGQIDNNNHIPPGIDKNDSNSKETIRGVEGFAFSTDQDFFNLLGPNRDANYTMGAQFSWFGPSMNNSLILGMPYFLSQIDGALFKFINVFNSNNYLQISNFNSIDYLFAFGYSAFTPEDIASPDPVFLDRPFSSSFFLRSGRLYYTESRFKLPLLIQTNFNLDIFGLRIGEFVQTGIHAAMLRSNPNGRPIPEGWKNQISDGFGLFGSYEANFVFSAPVNNTFIPYFGLGAAVGTYTKMTGILGVSTFCGGGALSKQNSLRDIPSFNGTGVFRQEKYTDRISKKTIESKTEFFTDFRVILDARVNLNAWLYNAYLQGLPYGNSDPHVLAFDEIEFFTGLYSLHLNLFFNTSFVRIGFEGRSREFNLDGAVPHGWGTIGFGWFL